MHSVFVCAIAAVSLRIACDMRRACSPTWLSPIAPSISACGVSAATESTTTTSNAPDFTSSSQMLNASSPLEGWETTRLSRSTPIFRAYVGSSACSASMKAAAPPLCCALATTWSASVVLPDDSCP